MKRYGVWGIVLLWLLWALVMSGYQVFIRARFAPERPDHALSWTSSETLPDSQEDKPYLTEPFLNDHVSWDSEYYISIAVAGYDDPQMRAIPPTFSWSQPQVGLKGDHPDWISMNYAFFPFYPLMMRVVAFPLHLFGMNEVAGAALAGVLVSMVGTLGALVALYDLGRGGMDEPGGLRAAFYLLIFPAGMFLAQVYTEGLFLGLSFGALALARRGRWIWAALLAMCATWTRAAGALLLLPMVWFWWKQSGLTHAPRRLSGVKLATLLLAGSPLLAYLIWWLVLGEPFHTVESRFFNRGLFMLGQSWEAWGQAWESMIGGNLQARAYFLVEFAAIAFGFTCCVLMLRRDPALALYSLAVILFSLTSGVAQGMHRYVMAAPVVFLLPARWGRSEAFDRIWTLGNVLLMGVLAITFSFDLWAG